MKTTGIDDGIDGKDGAIVVDGVNDGAGEVKSAEVVGISAGSGKIEGGAGVEGKTKKIKAAKGENDKKATKIAQKPSKPSKVPKASITPVPKTSKSLKSPMPPKSPMPTKTQKPSKAVKVSKVGKVGKVDSKDPKVSKEPKDSHKKSKYPRHDKNPFRPTSSYGLAFDILAAHPKGIHSQKLLEIYGKEAGKDEVHSRYDLAVLLSAKQDKRHKSCKEGFYVERENDNVRMIID
jgi:hypothetical protein